MAKYGVTIVQKKANERRNKGIEIGVIVLLCVACILFEWCDFSLLANEFRNRMLVKILSQGCGATAAILLMRRLHIRLFGRAENLVYLLPCLLVAVDNFQWFAFFSGKMQLVRAEFLDFFLFFAYCATVGLFEELIFRGVFFSLLAGHFGKNKKGLWLTYVLSSLIFGLAHIFNGFSLGTLLQVGYTILTGGLFAFCLIKTKNVLCCAGVHGLYNFCGLLYDKSYLGAGVAFDLGTAITMLVVSVAVGVFVLYKVWKYPDEERKRLYERLGVENHTKDSE